MLYIFSIFFVSFLSFLIVLCYLHVCDSYSGHLGMSHQISGKHTQYNSSPPLTAGPWKVWHQVYLTCICGSSSIIEKHSSARHSDIPSCSIACKTNIGRVNQTMIKLIANLEPKFHNAICIPCENLSTSRMKCSVSFCPLYIPSTQLQSHLNTK